MVGDPLLFRDLEAWGMGMKIAAGRNLVVHDDLRVQN